MDRSSVNDAEGCPQSLRVDGPKHSWRFDGDDPRIICAYCDEMRDALTGRIIRHGSRYSAANPSPFEERPSPRSWGFLPPCGGMK